MDKAPNKHGYFLRPRTPAPPGSRKRKRVSPPVKHVRAKSRTTRPPVTPPDHSPTKHGCRTCHPIPGHLKPLELARMSVEERRRTIDSAWDEIEAQEGSVSALPSTESTPASSCVPSHLLNVRLQIGILTQAFQTSPNW